MFGKEDPSGDVWSVGFVLYQTRGGSIIKGLGYTYTQACLPVCKLQANDLIYGNRPPTTAIIGYAINLRKTVG